MEPTRLFDLLDRLQTQYPNKKDIFARKTKKGWKKISVKDYYSNSHELAAALLNLEVKKGERIAIISNNRPEWNYFDMASSIINSILVPIYPTLNKEEYLYILNHCEPSIICIGNNSILQNLIDVLCNLKSKVKTIILLDDATDCCKDYPNLNFISFSELISIGKSKLENYKHEIDSIKEETKPDDVCTIIYTSGTTGKPKGVMLSHNNLLFNAIGHARKQIKDSSNKMLSFLPLCHIYERSMNYEYQYLGISTYYAESIATIAADLASSHADGFCGVPRVLEQMFVKLESAGKNLTGIKKIIYKWAFSFGENFDNYNTNALYLLKLKIADLLIYSKWREALGGKEMLVVSGGSAINAKIVRLFNAAKLHIYEGYGMTETSPVIAVNNPVDGINIIGTAGKPMDGTELKIADDGEILTRGPHIMLGYYKDPEYTKQVIDQDGWFHTGDIGCMQEGKYLKITDRKKEIFKLSAGKYIAPQIIENLLKNSSYIENCMVVGENQKFASAIIIPNFNKLHYWAAKKKIDYASNEDLLLNKHVLNKLHKEVESVNERLSPHEQIKKEKFICDDWSTANNTLSQTLKLKRNVLTNKYSEIINSIYKSGHSI